ncbi:solute carrier family 2, facilitated glucose transporter member 1 [Galendromus occidentalis]|uniref:Solute carrier family 2, facilitated glucose transporter member 1 n=1 Tax=Galendromus occidentalis TaxID=34638 RepID=A0AAJ7SFA0_9ACAR|nr:solute carrier family 2, facilitated glucose transporter member 1 [Galendromus occidentalis]
MFDATFVILGSFCMGFARFFGRYELLIIGRALVGVHAGIAGGIAPLYFAELSPHQWRGAIGSVYQLTVVISILLSQVFGLPRVLGGDDCWPLLLGGIILSPTLMFILLPWCPESPKFLLSKGSEQDARNALIRLRGTKNIEIELKQISSEAEVTRGLPPVGLSNLLREPVLKKAFTISVMVVIGQQLSGINAVMFYSTSIFGAAGFNQDAATAATVGMSVVNVLCTAYSMVIIEKAGRRTLLLTGFMGMMICTVILALSLGLLELHSMMSWTAVGGVMAFVIMFAIGPGSIPWFLVTELLPPAAQPIASSLCVATNWLCNAGIGMAFPILMGFLSHNSFLVFTVLLTVFYIYIYRKLPETKGRTIEEITAYFSGVELVTTKRKDFALPVSIRCTTNVEDKCDCRGFVVIDACDVHHVEL